MDIIGETIDDSIGEAFDKCGKILGLSYRFGPSIDKMSKKEITKFAFTIPKVEELNFSFSGLKTNFKGLLKNKKSKTRICTREKYNLCASLQYTISKFYIKSESNKNN